MTVETQVKSVTASGNGAATSFSFSPMVINAASELQVTHLVTATGVETVKTLNVDYSVSVTTYPGTGSITYPLSGSALPAGQQLVMKRILTLEQTTDLENQGGYFPDTLEQQLDKLVMIDLQQQEELDRAIKRKKGDTTLTDEELPNAVSASAGDVLALNSGKTAFEYVTPNTSAYVTFPASSTDNAIVRFNGTTGRSVQNSGITIDDNDIMVNNKQVRWTKGADIASASPLVLGTDGNFFDVTGTTGFSQITCTAGTLFMLQFDGALTLTNGANLILPYAANQTTQAGDRLIGFAEAANTVRVLSYVHATAAAGRTSLGLGTGDSPQVTGIELGHASDTTITRVSAGDIAVEGNTVYRAGGTDVAVADGGTGVSTFTDAGVLIGNGTGAIQVTTAGTSGQVLTSNGAGVDPTFQTAAGGKFKQMVSTVTGAVATGTTTMPMDDTIPQNTEGDQYMTLAITPTNSTNKLEISVVVNYAHSAVGHVTAALFQDTTASALAAADVVAQTADVLRVINFTHVMDAGTTSATTFKVRVGSESAGTLTFNGFSGARKLGGVLASSIVIKEIEP